MNNSIYIYIYIYIYILSFYVGYDFAFCQFLVTFIFVAAWIGTWQNLDSVFDTLLFNGDKYYSSIASTVVGALFSIVIIFTQEQVRNFAENGGL